jgi:hypothetical protein
MRPDFILTDLPDKGSIDSKLRRKRIEPHCRCSNFSHRVGVQFCIAIGFSASLAVLAYFVLVIFLSGSPFQVWQFVIAAIIGLVVTLVPFGTWANERFQHDLMHKQLTGRSVQVQFDTVVSLFSSRWAQDAALPASITFSLGTNTPQRRYGIGVFVPDDGAPFFGFNLFNGKFLFSQGVNLHRLGLALVRPVRVLSHSFGSFVF